LCARIGLKVYVDYSNEVWNSGFGQYNTNFDAACTETGGSPDVSSDGSHSCTGSGVAGRVLNFDGSTDPNAWSARRSAKRTVEISNLFRQVFGDAAMPGTSSNPTVRPLLESQLGWAAFWLSEQIHILENYYNNPFYGVTHPPSYYVWGGGGSGYYSPDNSLDSLNLTNIWSSLDFDSATWGAGVLKDDVDFVLPAIGHRVAYEAGQVSTRATVALPTTSKRPHGTTTA
jgi:hypothetical protein